jgi:hypothetical protein
MPRINRCLRRRQVETVFEEKYGGAHGLLDIFLCTGYYQPSAELASDVEALCVAVPRYRSMMERWMHDNAEEFTARLAKKKERGQCHA